MKFEVVLGLVLAAASLLATTVGAVATVKYGNRGRQATDEEARADSIQHDHDQESAEQDQDRMDHIPQDSHHWFSRFLRSIWSGRRPHGQRADGHAMRPIRAAENGEIAAAGGTVAAADPIDATTQGVEAADDTVATGESVTPVDDSVSKVTTGTEATAISGTMTNDGMGHDGDQRSRDTDVQSKHTVLVECSPSIGDDLVRSKYTVGHSDDSAAGMGPLLSSQMQPDHPSPSVEENDLGHSGVGNCPTEPATRGEVHSTSIIEIHPMLGHVNPYTAAWPDGHVTAGENAAVPVDPDGLAGTERSDGDRDVMADLEPAHQVRGEAGVALAGNTMNESC